MAQKGLACVLRQVVEEFVCRAQVLPPQGVQTGGLLKVGRQADQMPVALQYEQAKAVNRAKKCLRKAPQQFRASAIGQQSSAGASLHFLGRLAGIGDNGQAW